jgi:heavy metal translocating P-type ATPase
VNDSPLFPGHPGEEGFPPETAMVDESRVCAFCGLPVSTWNLGGDEAVRYCCFGCRLAAQIQSSDSDGADRFLLARLGIAVFFAMNVMAFTMALWTRDVYGGETVSQFEATLCGVFRWLTLLFSLPVYYLLGLPLAECCWRQIKAGAGAADLLLVVGVAAAFLASIPAVVLDNGPVYFEVGVLVLVFVTLGRWLEARCKQRASQALDGLGRLLPETVQVRSENGAKSVPLDDVVPGTVVVVRAGERVPCDGEVLEHTAIVDEQIWTGEGVPREKPVGASILAGSVNIAGDLAIRALAAPRDGALARLSALIRHARLTRGRYERFAERLSRVLLPFVVVVAASAGIWHGLHRGFEAGLLASLAVVLIACPCALGIATPLAVWAGLGTAARYGIIFESGKVLERLAGVRAILFDKTGTLTEGDSRVIAALRDDASSPSQIQTIAAALTRASLHPCSRAISRYLAASECAVSARIATHPGRGLEAEWPFENGPRTVRLGSMEFIGEMGAECPPELRRFIDRAESSGRSVVALAWDGRMRACFEIAESLRLEAAAALRRLRDDGLEVRILTGDRRHRAERLAGELGVAVDAELMPDDKWRLLGETRTRLGPVAMVGDGVNDGPALAGADVGFALGCGTDLARASAGVCLVGNDLLHIPQAIELSRRTVGTIKGNLFWAVSYNIVGVAVAAAGWLNPAIAAGVMVASSIFVIANSARLAREVTPANTARLAAAVRPEAA